MGFHIVVISKVAQTTTS